MIKRVLGFFGALSAFYAPVAFADEFVERSEFAIPGCGPSDASLEFQGNITSRLLIACAASREILAISNDYENLVARASTSFEPVLITSSVSGVVLLGRDFDGSVARLELLDPRSLDTIAKTEFASRDFRPTKAIMVNEEIFFNDANRPVIYRSTLPFLDDIEEIRLDQGAAVDFTVVEDRLYFLTSFDRELFSIPVTRQLEFVDQFSYGLRQDLSEVTLQFRELPLAIETSRGRIIVSFEDGSIRAFPIRSVTKEIPKLESQTGVFGEVNYIFTREGVDSVVFGSGTVLFEAQPEADNFIASRTRQNGFIVDYSEGTIAWSPQIGQIIRIPRLGFSGFSRSRSADSNETIVDLDWARFAILDADRDTVIVYRTYSE